MDIEQLIKRILNIYPMLQENTNWGERVLFYNPNSAFVKGAYVLTFKERDGNNDYSSNLNRQGVYRLNLKVSRKTFIKLFNEIPKRPEAGKTVDTGHNFAQLNQIMPHPIYGWMTWVCVLNPLPETIDLMFNEGFFHEAYQSAVATIEKRVRLSIK